jgi:hypothetical protein
VRIIRKIWTAIKAWWVGFSSLKQSSLATLLLGEKVATLLLDDFLSNYKEFGYISDQEINQILYNYCDILELQDLNKILNKPYIVITENFIPQTIQSLDDKKLYAILQSQLAVKLWSGKHITQQQIHEMHKRIFLDICTNDKETQQRIYHNIGHHLLDNELSNLYKAKDPQKINLL